MNTLIIGTGYHARRIYLPFLKEKVQSLTNLVCGLDIVSQKNVIEAYLQERGYQMKMYYTDDLEQDCISSELDRMLNDIVDKHKIDSVIIAIEPLMHYKYAKWALEHNLHILMDKPVTAEKDVVSDLSKVNKLRTDFLSLAKVYQIKKKQGIKFSLMAQRRFHPSYVTMEHKIKEVWLRTNCPITSIQICHSDGQWRFPDEIIDQDYHPYNQGYGKLSHSGYHSIDMLNHFVQLTSRNDKKIDNVEIYSSFVNPNDLMCQFNYADYKAIFPNYDQRSKYSQAEFLSKAQNFGEVDAFVNCTFKIGNQNACLASINLIHNGFSQRNWLSAEGSDLYKGNGRIRQEFYFIEQGPFQSILLSSFQSTEIKPECVNCDDYSFGGERHSEVHIFRNSALFNDWSSHETVNIKDIFPEYMTGYSRGHQEDARIKCVIDFFEAIAENRDPKSDLLQHWNSTNMLATIYEASMSCGGRVAKMKYE